jgi:lipopolysaccharide assembly outer membrane protein LptD (OstA)
MLQPIRHGHCAGSLATPLVAAAEPGATEPGAPQSGGTHARRAVRTAICTALVIAATVALALPAVAQERLLTQNIDAPYAVNADEMRYDEKRQLYEASGNVRVEQAGRVMTADWLLVGTESRVGVASGNVVIRGDGDTFQSDFAWVDLETLEIVANRATVDSAQPGFFISGSEIARTGPESYTVQNGLFTSCRCPKKGGRQPWAIETGEAEVTVGGYAVAKDVVLKTFGVPVMYSPIAVFPVKQERQTGFLIPSLGLGSRGGSEIRIPFFWAARDNLNITLTPIAIQERGLKLDGEIEYVFGEEGRGSGGFAFLNDDEIDGEDVAERFSSNRYAFWLQQETPIGDSGRLGLDLKRISDNQFVVDFENFSARERSARFLESTAFATWNTPSRLASVELSWLDDLQSPNDLDRDDFFLQRLPDVRVAWLPRDIAESPVRFGMDVRYTYFFQKDDPSVLRGNAPAAGGFFDTGPDGLFDPDEPTRAGLFNGADNHGDNRLGEGDGLFQEGELIADRGHRVDVYPKLSLPAQYGWLETISELGYRETLYAADEAGSESRGLLTGRLDARARFGRDFALGNTRLRHQIEPRLGFTYLDGDGEDEDNPLFIPASSVRLERIIDSDPRALLRDPSDRIDDARFVNFAIGNRFYTWTEREGEAEAAGLREIVELRVGAGYDLMESEPTDVFLDTVIRPLPNLSLAADLGYDTSDTQLSEATFAVSLQSTRSYSLALSSPSRRSAATVSYNFVRDRATAFENFLRDDDVFEDFERGLQRINQLSLGTRYVLTRQIDVTLDGYLSFEEASTRSGAFGMSFYSACACWQLNARVERRTRPDETRAVIELRLSGLGR